MVGCERSKAPPKRSLDGQHLHLVWVALTWGKNINAVFVEGLFRTKRPTWEDCDTPHASTKSRIFSVTSFCFATRSV
jgi:hypothetical protein